MTETEKELLFKNMKQLEQILVRIRERLINRGEDASCINRQVLYYYSQLHALVNLCDILKIDRQEYNWIYNL